jgi:enoyl-CoA hydratase/carnithine racemase
MVAARALASRLAEGPPIAIRLTKRMMYKQRAMDLDNALEDAAMATLVSNYTEDVKEGTAAFHQKRKPRFEGK